MYYAIKTRSMRSALRHAEGKAKPCIDYPLRIATSYSITCHEVKCFHVRNTNFRLFFFSAPCVCYHLIHRMQCWCSRRFDDNYCAKYYMASNMRITRMLDELIYHMDPDISHQHAHITLWALLALVSKPSGHRVFRSQMDGDAEFDVSLTLALIAS